MGTDSKSLLRKYVLRAYNDDDDIYIKKTYV